jgi:hypothetical protein
MKRLIWPLLMVLVLAACSRRCPSPTGSPSPTLPGSPTLMPQATSTFPGSPVPRITIVPSATRLQPTSPGESAATGASPTYTPTPPATPTPIPTATIIDAGATATLPVSPLPTSTLPESPLAPPRGTPNTGATPTPSPTSSGANATVSPTTPGDSSSTTTSTPTATATTAPSGAGWRFENVYTYYDAEYQELYIWGEVVNETGSDQRLTTLIPVVYDGNGNPITSEEDVDTIGSDYEQLREGVSLAPGHSLPFSFLVALPEGVAVEENYEILVAAEPAEPARADLDIVYYNSDASDWPDYYYVEGTFENPGPDLSEYVAIVVTLYDENGHVIGVGWFYEEGSSYLTTGEHDFEIYVELWEILYDLELEVYDHNAQLFGH